MLTIELWGHHFKCEIFHVFSFGFGTSISSVTVKHEAFLPCVDVSEII